MSFAASTVVSVLRGTATGHYGDDIDTDEVIASRIPASILQRPVTGARPVSGRADTPRTYALRLWPTNDVVLRQDDRIRDERTGAVYVVTTLVTSDNFIGLGSTRADLQRVT